MLPSEDWQFLMSPSDVERELLRLHQFRKLDYQIAGSIIQLTLPYANACEYARRNNVANRPDNSVRESADNHRGNEKHVGEGNAKAS